MKNFVMMTQYGIDHFRSSLDKQRRQQIWYHDQEFSWRLLAEDDILDPSDLPILIMETYGSIYLVNPLYYEAIVRGVAKASPQAAKLRESNVQNVDTIMSRYAAIRTSLPIAGIVDDLLDMVQANRQDYDLKIINRFGIFSMDLTASFNRIEYINAFDDIAMIHAMQSFEENDAVENIVRELSNRFNYLHMEFLFYEP